MIFKSGKKSQAAAQPSDRHVAQTVPANAFEAAWPFRADSPQVAGMVRDDAFLSIMLVDVTGLDWPGIADYLGMVRETARDRRMVPVLVVDLVDYRGLVAEGLAYDTLPDISANAPLAQDLDWAGYLAWRRHLLKEKWHPAAIINLGPHAEWDAP